MLPVSSVYNKEEPDNLLHDCQQEEWEEDEPEDEEDSFIEYIDGENTEAIIVDDGATRTIHIQGALCHLWENIYERVSTTRLHTR